MKNVWTTASGFPANVAYIHTPDPTGNVASIPNQRGWFVSNFLLLAELKIQRLLSHFGKTC